MLALELGTLQRRASRREQARLGLPRCSVGQACASKRGSASQNCPLIGRHVHKRTDHHATGSLSQCALGRSTTMRRANNTPTTKRGTSSGIHSTYFPDPEFHQILDAMRSASHIHSDSVCSLALLCRQRDLHERVHPHLRRPRCFRTYFSLSVSSACSCAGEAIRCRAR